ncbi:hypothetical protein Pfo_027197, partial [Paulownia fortunei]
EMHVCEKKKKTVYIYIYFFFFSSIIPKLKAPPIFFPREIEESGFWFALLGSNCTISWKKMVNSRLQACKVSGQICFAGVWELGGCEGTGGRQAWGFEVVACRCQRRRWWCPRKWRRSSTHGFCG